MRNTTRVATSQSRLRNNMLMYYAYELVVCILILSNAYHNIMDSIMHTTLVDQYAYYAYLGQYQLAMHSTSISTVAGQLAILRTRVDLLLETTTPRVGIHYIMHTLEYE